MRHIIMKFFPTEKLHDLKIRCIHPFLYLYKRFQFGFAAWCRSWDIVRAFDSRAWLRRLIINVVTAVALVTLAIALIVLLVISSRGTPSLSENIDTARTTVAATASATAPLKLPRSSTADQRIARYVNRT